MQGMVRIQAYLQDKLLVDHDNLINLRVCLGIKGKMRQRTFLEGESITAKLTVLLVRMP
jgi:hypothetical protein